MPLIESKYSFLRGMNTYSVTSFGSSCCVLLDQIRKINVHVNNTVWFLRKLRNLMNLPLKLDNIVK
jgi:hypothetical protein